MPDATRLRTPWPTGSPPLPHYARPMLRRDDWLNLNGYWDCAVVSSAGPAAGQRPPPRRPARRTPG